MVNVWLPLQLNKKIETELLFTDTDSLTYEIKSEIVYPDYYRDKHLLDLSKYPKDSNIFDPVNEKVIGKTKDVLIGKSNHKFIGIKWKMHCFRSDDGKVSNTAKEINTAIELNV